MYAGGTYACMATCTRAYVLNRRASRRRADAQTCAHADISAKIHTLPNCHARDSNLDRWNLESDALTTADMCALCYSIYRYHISYCTRSYMFICNI